jgi:hypothetical protein
MIGALNFIYWACIIGGVVIFSVALIACVGTLILSLLAAIMNIIAVFLNITAEILNLFSNNQNNTFSSAGTSVNGNYATGLYSSYTSTYSKLFNQPAPAILYHGTKTRQNAMSIIRDGWLVSSLKEVFMTSNFQTATGYGNYIVECHVAPISEVRHKFGEIFTASIPHALNGIYYFISGVTPMRVLSADSRMQIYP